ncbi:hypothetical protein ACSBR2_007095 [Camellia fascicularis]
MHEIYFTLGFSVSMGLGFILGFWTVLGTMLLNSPSRYAYFKFLDHTKKLVICDNYIEYYG